MVSSSDHDVGRRIRERREQLGLSLREVAARSGLSLNAISRIERGDNSPTVASLQLIAGALGVSITDFFGSGPAASIVYVTPDDRTPMEQESTRIESLGTGLRDQQLEPFFVTVLPGDHNPAPITHAGQEFVYCISGRVDYQINEMVYHLAPGHSLLFEASQPHCFWNPNSSPAQLIFVFQAVLGYQHHAPP